MSKGAFEDDQLFWKQTRYAFMNNAGDTTAFTGYFYGGVGYGMVLLKARAVGSDLEMIRFPDDPY